jgi:membrane protein YdbS with pleckstrin-like domain
MHFAFFPHFFEKPTRFRFENQEADEHIEFLLRRHPITNVYWIVAGSIAFILPVAAIFLDQALGFNFVLSVNPKVVVTVLVFYYMLVFIYFIENFLDWYFNVDIVTNQHVVDIRFSSLLARDIIEIGLEDIESLSVKTGGILDSLLDYGDIYMMTAAERNNIEFMDVHRPDYIVDNIQELIEKRKLFFEGETS